MGDAGVVVVVVVVVHVMEAGGSWCSSPEKGVGDHAPTTVCGCISIFVP